MKKLVKGIVEFRNNIAPGYREKFAKLALGQSPDTMLIACCDSRVVPNLFASTDPGDLFVIRNVGNLIPACGADGHSIADESEAAALEFSLMNLNVSEIIVCGHSECGAMQAILDGRNKVPYSNLRAWLRHGEPTQNKMKLDTSGLTPINALSQRNVLLQLDHLASYPVLKEKLASGKVRLHGWWFELKTADVYAYDPEGCKFNLIDEKEAERILARMQ